MFLTAREVRSVFISIYPVTHDSGRKPRGSRSHQRQQQEARTFASSCFPDVLVNVAPMNAARLFVLRTYMYSMVDSFVASTYVSASLSLHGNEGYRRIYPLKNFVGTPRPRKFYYMKKEHPKILQHENFPIYGSLYVKHLY